MGVHTQALECTGVPVILISPTLVKEGQVVPGEFVNVLGERGAHIHIAKIKLRWINCLLPGQPVGVSNYRSLLALLGNELPSTTVGAEILTAVVQAALVLKTPVHCVQSRDL